MTIFLYCSDLCLTIVVKNINENIPHIVYTKDIYELHHKWHSILLHICFLKLLKGTDSSLVGLIYSDMVSYKYFKIAYATFYSWCMKRKRQTIKTLMFICKFYHMWHVKEKLWLQIKKKKKSIASENRISCKWCRRTWCFNRPWKKVKKVKVMLKFYTEQIFSGHTCERENKVNLFNIKDLYKYVK